MAFSQHGWSICKDWLILTLYTFAAMLLSGASLQTNPIHTALSALYWTTLAFLLEPPFLSRQLPFSFAGHVVSHDSSFIQPSRCTFHSPWFNKAVASIDSSNLVFHTTLAVTIPMQILCLYDRGWQWQRWPVPVMVGSTIGWTFGCFLVAWKQVFPSHT